MLFPSSLAAVIRDDGELGDEELGSVDMVAGEADKAPASPSTGVTESELARGGVAARRVSEAGRGEGDTPEESDNTNSTDRARENANVREAARHNQRSRTLWTEKESTSKQPTVCATAPPSQHTHHI
jgi:hypothetical protein